MLRVADGFLELTCDGIDLGLGRRKLTPERVEAVRALGADYLNVLEERSAPTDLPLAQRLDGEQARLIGIGRRLRCFLRRCSRSPSGR